jgi:hypothetical protein
MGLHKVAEGLAMVRKTISIALIASLAATGAQAALLTNVQGAVTVDRGYGSAPAGSGSVIAPGERVRAREGSADIVYDNGCIVKVDPGQTMVVLSPPPACHIASEVATSPIYLAGGAVAIGGGVAAAILLSQTKPASP